jgi:hypothetical protein
MHFICMAVMTMRTDRLPKMLSSSVLSRRPLFDVLKRYASGCLLLAALP